MIIESSAIKMNAHRSFRSFTTNPGLIGIGMSGGTEKFLQTALTTAQNANKGTDSNEKQQDFSNPQEDLMAHYSNSRSIRGLRVTASRNTMAIHKIRSQSIGYMLHQLFGAGTVSKTPYPPYLPTIPAADAFCHFRAGRITNRKKPVFPHKVRS